MRNYSFTMTETGTARASATDVELKRLDKRIEELIRTLQQLKDLVAFADARYERLADISSAHIYNLRKLRGYRERVMVFTKTRPTPTAIGERRRPEPGGRPGYLRVDTVHQGDLDGVKGVYHINAVDTVTQWQVVGCASKISERFLIPVLRAMLHQFPFRSRSFHSDNESEFVNRTTKQGGDYIEPDYRLPLY